MQASISYAGVHNAASMQDEKIITGWRAFPAAFKFLMGYAYGRYVFALLAALVALNIVARFWPRLVGL